MACRQTKTGSDKPLLLVSDTRGMEERQQFLKLGVSNTTLVKVIEWLHSCSDHIYFVKNHWQESDTRVMVVAVATILHSSPVCIPMADRMLLKKKKTHSSSLPLY